MIGETISHYRIEAKLGEGGMGVVYRAFDTRLQRTVALKFLPPGSIRDPEAKARFIHEARAASALDHPNVCTLHQIEETEDGRLFIAMACYEGETLRERIARGPLPMNEAIEIVRQTAAGMAKAHERGIVHRDIKPANVFLTGDGLVKILDFGLAKLSGQTQVTRAGTTLGTVTFMSPEQARGEEADERSDVWALGGMMYQMLCGRPPFQGDHPQAVIHQILNAPPEPVTALRPEVPALLATVVDRCLQKDPARRYADAGEMQEALQAAFPDPSTVILSPPPRTASSRPLRAGILGAVLALIAAGGFFLLRPVLFPPEDETIDSVAVLPLDNLSRDPAQEYFADGLTEALIAELARISALRVISRTSVMRYKETDLSLPQIAQELDVDAILEGSVLREGNRVRITAQLIRARDDRHLWAESYQRDLEDVLGLQQEIALLVAEAIDVQLTPGETAALSTAPTVNAAAQEAYLRGRFLWNRRTPEQILRSMEYFQQAIDLDPDFAPAHAALASAQAVIVPWGLQSPLDIYARAERLARRALELDENQAEAMGVLASARLQLSWDWEEAGRLFRRSVTLNPGSATVHQWYGSYLKDLGRFEEALAEAELACRLDPLSFVVQLNQAEILYYAGRYEDAIAQCERIMEINDRHPYTNIVLAQALLQLDRFDEAADSYLAAMAKVNIDATILEAGRRSFAEGSIIRFGRWMIDEGIDHWDQPYNRSYWRATILAYQGEHDAALEELEQTLAVSCFYLRMLAIEPAFAGLHEDPRFQDILRRIGLGK